MFFFCQLHTVDTDTAYINIIYKTTDIIRLNILETTKIYLVIFARIQSSKNTNTMGM
jgi:hypothetical protein